MTVARQRRISAYERSVKMALMLTEAMLISQATLDLLRDRNVFSKAGAGDRWRVAERLLFEPNCRLEPYTSIHSGNRLPRSMGAFSYSHSHLPHSISIGRYCSLGSGIGWMGDAHPLEWVTTSPFSYGPTNDLQGFAAYFADHPRTQAWAFNYPAAPVRIGHDVWIGDQAMIKGGVSVGDGAIIAARAVVTKDVPAYAVVAGNPARVVKRRFPDELVEMLLATAWWRFGPDVLASLPLSEPEVFISALGSRIGAGAIPLNVEPLTGHEIIATLSP